MALNITMENFEREVLNSSVPTLVDFWAPWCPPCKALSPVIDALSQETEGVAKICKVNIDDEPELAEQFDVMTIPTLLFYRNGELVDRFSESRSKEELRSILGV